MLSKPQPRKKYVFRADSLKRVEEELRFRVSSNLWLPGVMLPSRRSLATEFDVDLHTVQRAIAPLLDDGTLTAVAGRGTFVAQSNSSPMLSPSLPPTPQSNGHRLLHREQGGLSRTGSSSTLGTLGIVTAYDTSRSSRDDIAGTGSQEIVRSLERSFVEAGGKTLVYNLLRPEGSWETVPTATDALIRHGVDALAVIGIDRDPVLRDVRLPAWYSKSLPVVHISGQGDYLSSVHVYFDNKQAGLQAAEHLLNIGCNSIVFLVPFTAPWLDDRIEGVRLAIDRAGLDPSRLKIHPTNHPLVQWSSEASLECDASIEDAFETGIMTGGVIAPNDGVAHHVIRHAIMRGKTPGRDFALIGFDDIPSSTFAGLTSLRPPFEEMGREASSLLIRLLGGDRVSLQLCLPSLLLIRNSTNTYSSR